ncbi:UDP-N-acetylglucosamine--N-acetylmuramyl-(pentapeptide) pyrophosphoryl-undecaprenol N-acetylglucosamine transferase [Candidatus Parcubacteria bacterium]|nr:UDP-N-acetylglucosamine--N-acetylmuramyl-(pentapeptide) pyrophosphoryl-undecaprenol N-acetylglucosamine transferase [Candidatus Parcubacteria bacterium]
MKILLTGGGSGGHFYPIIAVAQALNDLSRENRLLEAELFYVAPNPYNPGLLYENGITFRQNFAGKRRRYFSLLNFFDLFKTAIGIFQAIITVFRIYPDVVFGKGGFASFPVIFAAKILRIPVIIHESDTVPGRVNRWAGHFAKKIAVSYPEAAGFFPKDRVAFTGNPVRKELLTPLTSGAYEFLGLDNKKPVVLVLGGSLGSQILNDTVIEALPKLLTGYQIIHQTGKENLDLVNETVSVVLSDEHLKERYKPFDYLNNLALRMSAGIASVVVSRAGSAIFEIAAWHIPSIIVPISDSNGDHQKQNAFAYARSGACVVIEEANLTGNILASEIQRLIENQKIRETMRAGTEKFFKIDSAEKIAKEIIKIALKHEE